MTRILAKKLIGILILIAFVGCQQPTAVSETEPVVVEATATPVEIMEETAVSPTSTPAPTQSPTPNPQPKVEQSPTSTPSPTPIPLTPTPLPTYAPLGPDVPQSEYAGSPCSDRFPCNDDVEAWEARIQVPEGFKASYFAYLPNPDAEDRGLNITSITFGPDDLLYVATMQGDIFTIDPHGQTSLYFSGLTVPTGLAFEPGTGNLYVSNRVTDSNVDGEAQISVIVNGRITTLIDGLPCCYVGMHGPNGIAFGPDGYAYVGVGGRADHGEVLDGSNNQDERHPMEAAILRFSPDGSDVSVYARGFRNPYDIAWDASGNLWAGDNGRDGNIAANDIAPDELHLVQPGGEHGYPYYDCPACFGVDDGVQLVEPIFAFEPHSVPTGMTVYQHEQFPGYFNNLFVTLWTALPFAERVMRFLPDGSAGTFATGFAAPMDVVVAPDGNLFVADFATGLIFRIEYVGQ